jgi:hypothetical protein
MTGTLAAMVRKRAGTTIIVRRRDCNAMRGDVRFGMLRTVSARVARRDAVIFRAGGIRNCYR